MNDYSSEQGLRPASPVRGTTVGESEANALPLIAQYLRMFWRWRQILFGAFAFATAAGIIATLLMTRQYTASTTIEISREADRVVQIQDVRAESNAADLEFYQTQYGLLKSHTLAERVVRQLHLADDPKFFVLLHEKLYDPDGKPARFTPVGQERRVRKAADALLRRLDVAPVRLSRLVQVSITTPDPALSEKLINAWSANFIQSNLERRYQATAYARRFLEERLDQLRGKLETSERDLVRYAAREQIINVPGPQGPTGSSTEQSLVATNLGALNNELNAAKAERIKAESRMAKGGFGAATGESLQNLSIGGLRQKRAEIAADYARTLTQFQPNYPPAKAMAAQLAALDRAIASEEGRVKSSLISDYRDAESREQGLQQQVETLKSSLLDQRQRSIQYNIYQREADTNRQLYDALLQRYKEIGVAGGVGTNNVSVIDPATAPELPSRPKLFLNLAIAWAFGLALGVAAVFALEQIDETITDPADVERKLTIPLLGTIPKSESAPVELLADRKSNLVEAYLALQTNLEFTTAHGFPRSLAVTSTRPSEGKSTSAYAVALTLARAKRRVLLIDGDMRNPSIHHLAQLPNHAGFSNLLAGSDDYEAVTTHLPEQDFSVILSGPLPPNAAELLTGERLSAVLAHLCEEFDVVIVDSPPVMGLADAPLIASRVEGTIFVVEAHGIRARLVRLALGRLANARAHVLGAVLAKFESARAMYGYGYDYGYTYGQRSILDKLR